MFHKKLRELRLSRGLTQAELAKCLSLASATLAMYEQGRREPDFETLQKIANYFGVSTDFMLGVDTKENPLNDREAKLIDEFKSLPEPDQTYILDLIKRIRKDTP